MRQKETDCRKLAEDHVEWFLKTIKPLLIEHFVHGYKHGKNEHNNLKFKPEKA